MHIALEKHTGLIGRILSTPDIVREFTAAFEETLARFRKKQGNKN